MYVRLHQQYVQYVRSPIPMHGVVGQHVLILTQRRLKVEGSPVAIQQVASRRAEQKAAIYTNVPPFVFIEMWLAELRTSGIRSAR